MLKQFFEANKAWLVPAIIALFLSGFSVVCNLKYDKEANTVGVEFGLDPNKDEEFDPTAEQVLDAIGFE